MSTDDFPRVPLLFGPSPIHPLPRLSAALGGAVEIWAKREDCNSGIALGGNKVRKLEYLAADALAQGCDTLVSIGGQSNHTRRHRRGQASRPRRGDRPGALGRLGRSRVRGRGQHPAYASWAAISGWIDQASTSGFVIAGGRRSDPSWTRAASPIPRGRVRSSPWRPRVRELGPRSRGTRSTARRVVRPRHSVLRDRFDARRDDRGVALEEGRSAGDRHRCLEDAGQDPRTGDQYRAATAQAIGVERELRDDEITLVDGYAGPVYGVPDEGTIEAIQLAARTDGMITTPSTRASRWPALIGLIRSGEIPPGHASSTRI